MSVKETQCLKQSRPLFRTLSGRLRSFGGARDNGSTAIGALQAPRRILTYRGVVQPVGES